MKDFLRQCPVGVECGIMDYVMFRNYERLLIFESKTVPGIAVNDIRIRIIFLEFCKRWDELVNAGTEIQVTVVTTFPDTLAEILCPDIDTGSSTNLSYRDLHDFPFLLYPSSTSS